MEKVVLITGGSLGIGNSLVKTFASNGYNIIFTYLTNKEKALNLKEEIENNYKVKVLTKKVDISNEDDIKEMIKNINNNFKKIDVLINNASHYKDNSYLDKSKEEFLKVLEVNVVGTFLITKYILNLMDKGIVINISSRDAYDTYNDLSMDYCASKAGINSLTKTFSLANTNNKFISIMLPFVNTESIKEMYEDYLKEELKRTNQKRLIEPSEVAESIYKLVNDKKLKTGDIKILDIDGSDKICIKNLE